MNKTQIAIAMTAGVAAVPAVLTLAYKLGTKKGRAETAVIVIDKIEKFSQETPQTAN